MSLGEFLSVCILFFVNAAAQNADIRQRAVRFVVVENVADDELVRNDLADVVRLEFDLAAVGLVEQSAGADRFCPLQAQIFREVGEGASAVDDVLDDEDIAV